IALLGLRHVDAVPSGRRRLAAEMSDAAGVDVEQLGQLWPTEGAELRERRLGAVPIAGAVAREERRLRFGQRPELGAGGMLRPPEQRIDPRRRRLALHL